MNLSTIIKNLKKNIHSKCLIEEYIEKEALRLEQLYLPKLATGEPILITFFGRARAQIVSCSNKPQKTFSS